MATRTLRTFNTDLRTKETKIIMQHRWDNAMRTFWLTRKNNIATQWKWLWFQRGFNHSSRSYITCTTSCSTKLQLLKVSALLKSRTVSTPIGIRKLKIMIKLFCNTEDTFFWFQRRVNHVSSTFTVYTDLCTTKLQLLKTSTL